MLSATEMKYRGMETIRSTMETTSNLLMA